MDDDRLRLQFGPGDPSGFTPAGIAGFSNLKPPAIVRELIQNSLDAANEADRSLASVRFQLTQCKTQYIPSMTDYYDAFEAAVDTHRSGGELPSQARRVETIMRAALENNEQDVLAVLDNGVGLDEDKMHALLSDGISHKDGTATGTFGNGHSVVIPASDLRYILYGGITANGNRIGSGHAVIASWKEGDQPHQRSGNGYLVKGFYRGSFRCAKNCYVPDFIADYLTDIQETTGHGTVVIIPAFNHFRRRRVSLWDIVSKAAACNFFQAIAEERLVVEVDDYRSTEPPKRLDRSTLEEVLEKNKNELRSRGFLSGQKAYSAYTAFRYGDMHQIKTKLGSIRVSIRDLDSGTPRIDLCRNGMWITHGRHIPGFYHKFSDRKPFHAVLLLDSESGHLLHELIRNAEGPLHDRLDVRQRLEPSERPKLLAALRQIKDKIRSLIPEITNDPYAPDDFLTVDFGQDNDKGNSRPSFWGTPAVVSGRSRRSVLSSTTSTRPKTGGGGRQAHPLSQICNHSFVWRQYLWEMTVEGFSLIATEAVRMHNFACGLTKTWTRLVTN